MKPRIVAIAVAVVPALVVIVAGWVLWIAPTTAQRADAEADTTRVSNELRAAQVRLGGAREFVAGGASAVQELEGLRQALPEGPDVGGFVTLNDRAARENGVQILSLVPEQPDVGADEGFAIEDDGAESDEVADTTVSPLGDDVSDIESLGDDSGSDGSTALPDGVEAVPVTISVSGPDDRIPAYLAALSDLSRLVLIDEVSTVAEGDGNTAATMRLSVLYRSD